MMIEALTDGTFDTVFIVFWKNIIQQFNWMTEEM